MKQSLIGISFLFAVSAASFAQEVVPNAIQVNRDTLVVNSEQAVLKTKTRSNQSNDKVMPLAKDSLDIIHDGSDEQRLKSKTKSNQSNDRKPAIKDSIPRKY
jgi:hypothetical protein